VPDFSIRVGGFVGFSTGGLGFGEWVRFGEWLGFGGWLFQFLHAGYVFSYDVEFEVDGVSGFNGLYISVFECVRDDGDVEFCLFDVEYGEADAVEANGAFFNDQMAEFFGEFEAELPATVLIVAFEAGGGGVDMSLDDVAVEAAVHDHASFEVNEVAGLPGAEVGLFEGFFDGGDAVEVAVDFFDGEADAVVGKGLVDL